MTNTSSSARRQAVSRTKKKAAGFVRFTLRFDATTAARLRRLARSDGTTQARVIEAALALADNRQLLKDVQAWAAKRAFKRTPG